MSDIKPPDHIYAAPDADTWDAGTFCTTDDGGAKYVRAAIHTPFSAFGNGVPSDGTSTVTINTPPICRKCKGIMKPGKAIAQTYVGGMPDFIGDAHPVTFSAGGPGELIDCLKCQSCGHSFMPSVNSGKG